MLFNRLYNLFLTDLEPDISSIIEWIFPWFDKREAICSPNQLLDASAIVCNFELLDARRVTEMWSQIHHWFHLKYGIHR